MNTSFKKSQEMSTEDIFKSIRDIISSGKKDATKTLDSEEVLELTNIVSEEACQNTDFDESQDRSAQQSLLNTNDDHLITDPIIDKANNSFRQFTQKAKTISHDNKRSKALTVEEMVVRMMRPQIKEWIEHNLPIIVEKLLEKEISRLIPSKDED